MVNGKDGEWNPSILHLLRFMWQERLVLFREDLSTHLPRYTLWRDTDISYLIFEYRISTTIPNTDSGNKIIGRN